GHDSIEDATVALQLALLKAALGDPHLPPHQFVRATGETVQRNLARDGGGDGDGGRVWDRGAGREGRGGRRGRVLGYK
ncbi:hypothetical protein B484DRAFT_397302, partial [Ochromonadaceae sp. CCMP2298]